MTKLVLIRDYKKTASIGRLIFDGKEFCKTLERPNLGNSRDDKDTLLNESSCIPEGVYKVVHDKTGNFKYFRLLNVPDRVNIEIHPANIADELLGCIALGEKIEEDVMFKGQKRDYFLTNSLVTCRKARKAFPKEFELEITSIDSLCKVMSQQ